MFDVLKSPVENLKLDQRVSPVSYFITPHTATSGRPDCHKEMHILKLFSYLYVNPFSSQLHKNQPVQKSKTNTACVMYECDAKLQLPTWQSLMHAHPHTYIYM